MKIAQVYKEHRVPFLRKCFSFILLIFFQVFASAVFAAERTPPIPARVGGTVTIDGVQLSQAKDAGYTFKVTRENGAAYDPTAEDLDGLNASNFYSINIPIYDADAQPGGANPGETALIHVYKNGVALNVTSPDAGKFSVGNSGDVNQMNLIASAFSVGYVDPNGQCDNQTPCYATIQEAIDAPATSKTTLKVVRGEFSTFHLTQSKQIKIQGGWDDTFTSQTPQTTFIKSPQVTAGSVTLQNLIVKP